MKIKTAATFATDALRRDSLRSALTLIGIFLGLFTAVMILGVGKGIILQVQDLVSAFGTDKIMVMPFNFNKIIQNKGAMPAWTEFKESDVNELKGITCIQDSAEMVYQSQKIEYNNKTSTATVMGVTQTYITMFGDYYEVEHGRLFTDRESTSTLLGHTIANELFDEEILPGKKLIILNRSFTVVGTLKKVGQSGLNSEDDQMVLIPLKEGEVLFDKQGKRDMVMFQVRKDCDLEETKKEVEVILARRAGVSVENAAFSVITSQFIIDTVNDSLNILYAGATAVGLIASLVSAVGIANTMFTSVFRRKKEIGIMKAIGAKKNDIIMIFLLESIILSLVGALLGAVFGTVVGVLLKEFYGMPFVVDWIVVVIAVLVGIFVGVIAGILPARSAASIDAIEAIRQ